jgi:hypothetical protein
MRAPRYLLLTALIAAVTLTGCSDSSSSDDSASSGMANKAAAPAARLPEQQAGGAGPAQDGAPPGGAAKDGAAKAPDLNIDQRAIIYTGSITVRVKDVNAAATQAAALAAGVGGFVGGDERHSGNTTTGVNTASVILRVPGDRFTSVVQQLSGLGKEEQRQTSTEDVTVESIDLDARITVQQARVDSGRKLLAQAKSLTDLVMLEKEVASRESDLAALQAKKRRLADLTTLSTITAVLLGPEAVATVPTTESPAGFLSGLTKGWHSLLASLAVLLTVLGALLPWLVALGIPVGIAIYLARRYGKRTVGTAAPATAGAPLPQHPSRTVEGPPSA